MSMHAKTLGIALIALCPLAAFAQEAPQDPVAEYEALLRDIRGLEAYNALLERQIASQLADVEDFRIAIEGVPDLERQLPPLLITMVDGLDAFVERDVPFRTGERRDRIAGLYALIEDPDLNDVVKLRRILEAWAIEVEYGGGFQTYQEDQDQLPAGFPAELTNRTVDFIAVGRVGLLFQTSDEEAVTGAWDYRNNAWVILGSEHRNPVRQALRMARNQIAPELVLLPTIPPQTD